MLADGPRYRLRPGIRSDADEFTALAERAELAVRADDSADAQQLYESALRLWRGEPLADVALVSAHPAVVSLAWQRSAVVMAYVEAAATAGWNEKVLGHLQALTASEPLNEKAHALLMLALTASGQRAAALKLYANLSDRLAQELGVRPGPQSADYFGQALVRYREIGDLTGEARTLGNLGLAHQLQGRYGQAIEYHQQALAVCREAGDRTSEADALTNLGDVHLQAGRHQQATNHHQHALDVFREIGHQAGEAKALNDGLGDAFLAVGSPGLARVRHASALALASQAGHPHQQARAHDGLGRSYQAADDHDQARQHWLEAPGCLTLATGRAASHPSRFRPPGP